MKRTARNSALLCAAMLLVVGGCNSSKSPTASPTTTVNTPTSSGSATTGGSAGSGPIQTSGPRTVLSPIGINLRAAPSKTGAVVGTAAQGVTLTVLSHTDEADGWYQVKGATVTGYITDDPVLSANGTFTPYSSTPHNFSVLYPEDWTQTEAPPASVVFHGGTGGDSLVVTTAATASQLGRGRAGYRQDSSTEVVVCGVTGNLVTYVQSGAAATTSTAPPGGTVAERYLIQVHLTLDAQHALGVDANLADLAELQQIKDIINSISFPFPQCELGATPSDASTTVPATTVP